MTGQAANVPVPACWSWSTNLPTEEDTQSRFWDGIDTTGYSASTLDLLREAAGAMCNDDTALATWQAGRCAICGETDRRLVCDHDHATGLVRGWLCISCNTREGAAVGPGTVFSAYRERPPTETLGLTIRYRDPLTREYVLPELPGDYGWEDNAAAGLT